MAPVQYKYRIHGTSAGYWRRQCQRSWPRTRYSFTEAATDIAENQTGTVPWPRLPVVAEGREVFGVSRDIRLREVRNRTKAPPLSPTEGRNRDVLTNPVYTRNDEFPDTNG